MKNSILFVYLTKSTFIEKDIRLLQEDYQLNEYSFNPVKRAYLPLFLFHQFITLLFTLHKYQVIICRFAGYHSLIPAFLAKIFNKKFIVISGGTDCVAFPSIKYGNFQNKPYAWFTKHSFRLASHIAPVYKSLMISDYTYYQGDFPKQGCLFHDPKIHTPFTEIYNGYDPDFWKLSCSKEPFSFITVALGLHENRRRILKGIDLILVIAPYFPQCIFYIIGSEHANPPPTPQNVKVIPAIPNKDLRSLYSKSQYYLQLSISEGFPNSLCEAMLCQCVPIVSNVSSMPFIVKDVGFILYKKDVHELKLLMNRVLQADTQQLGIKARKRIAENFTEGIRKKKLLNMIRLLRIL